MELIWSLAWFIWLSLFHTPEWHHTSSKESWSYTLEYMATLGVPSSTRDTRTLQVNCCVYPLNVHLNNITSITATAVIEVNRGDANNAFCASLANLCVRDYKQEMMFLPRLILSSCVLSPFGVKHSWPSLNRPDAKPQLLSCLLTTESGP